MAALNTVVSSDAIIKSPLNYGASPAGTILAAGDKLTVTTVAGTVCRVWNVGNVSRPVVKADEYVNVASGASEEFGPYPGPRNFWFGLIGDRASYSISRDK